MHMKKIKINKYIKGTVIFTLFNKLKCNNDLVKYLYAYIKTSTEQTFISTHIAFTFIIHSNSLHILFCICLEHVLLSKPSEHIAQSGMRNI